MYRVLDILGMEPPNRAGKILSLDNPSERTPSLHIYDDHFHDFSTNEHGDQFAFVMKVKGCDFREAVNILSGRTDPGRAHRRAPTRRKMLDLTGRFEGEAIGSTKAQTRASGWVAAKWPYLNLEDLTGWGIKCTEHSLWVPHRDDEGIVRGIKVRDTYSGAKHSVEGSRYTSRLYRVTEATMKPVAILVEGESDLWCIEKWVTQRRLDAVVGVYALPCGAAAWHETWADVFDLHRVVILALDDDRAGRQATEVLTGEIGVHRTGSVVPPGGRVAEAIDDADVWLEPVVKWAQTYANDRTDV